MKRFKIHRTKRNAVYGVTLLIITASIAGGLLWTSGSSPRSLYPAQTTYRAGQIPVTGTKLAYLTGTSSALSKTFEAPRFWDIYWNFLCDELTSPGYFMITVLNKDGTTRAQVMPIIAKGISGFGDQKYTMSRSDEVTLRVDSNCSWRLTAKSSIST